MTWAVIATLIDCHAVGGGIDPDRDLVVLRAGSVVVVLDATDPTATFLMTDGFKSGRMSAWSPTVQSGAEETAPGSFGRTRSRVLRGAVPSG